MPPRFQPTQTVIQRPLQNEILTLNKLLGNDILEQAARILDHFAATRENKLEATSFQTPPQLNDKLLEKCEDFETVCDQIYFILEQSKRVLQLEWQQKMIQVKADNLAKEKQLAEKSEEDQQHPEAMDTDMDFDSSHMDVSLSLDDTTMVEANNSQQQQKQGLNTENIDEEDMEELLQIQRDRLDRLKKVIVLGMDADTVKANGRNGGKEDLLF
ncbi:uncharacterized protein EV154DRAFT_480289 [Mucor mucedo]|uniref:Uncharacterized protein n=1 Tax=Mucor saturninus TaxID=64648 RepID=A0A8H7V0D1_9FUNG|nr:uncharacterized protein EV154DRAFT_480289 [Mucor mucedo]KAG2205416.1 hypothetical protein INT47_007201 [Mucor saturninus]KAI7892344.1 hypothetical protein EV154DRAFT_480289 [Mucor mucedo]